MAGFPRVEILGIEAWPPQLTGRLARRSSGLLTVVVTPRADSITSVQERYPQRDIVILATDPSAVEAALLIHAGADAYVTDPAELRGAIDALSSGEAWMSPVAASAVCRLARLPGDPAFDRLAALARVAAGGQPWPSARRALGLTGTRSALAELRQAL
jgi:DNA-binding NarL/FixJ family response regulator